MPIDAQRTPRGPAALMCLTDRKEAILHTDPTVVSARVEVEPALPKAAADSHAQVLDTGLAHGLHVVEGSRGQGTQSIGVALVILEIQLQLPPGVDLRIGTIVFER